MATLSTPITGTIGFITVGTPLQLSCATPSGVWSSGNTAVATIASNGIVTGVSAGTVTITYTVGADTATLTVSAIVQAYTNGMDISRLLPVLIGRKGWKQPTNSVFTAKYTLNATNTSCTSGRYYQFDNAACQPERLVAAQPDPAITNSNLNAYLTDLQVGVALDALNSVFRQRSVVEDPKILFEKTFRTSYQPIPNNSKFCGWMLYTAKGNYTSKLESVALTMSVPCEVTLYLYNDLRSAPLWSKTVNVDVANDQTIVNIDDCYLSRLNDEHKGGVFYFGYYQDQIAAQGALGVDVYLNWWEDPNMFAYQGFEANSTYNAGSPASSTFVRDTYFSNYRTYGLGLELSTYFDFTHTIARNAHEFDNLMGLMMQQKCIEEIIHSSATNSTNRIGQDELAMLYETLNGRQTALANGGVAVSYKTSLKNKIELEVKRVQTTFSPKQTVMSVLPPVNDFRADLSQWGNMIPLYP